MNNERIQSIDGLRGFSLLGILIANMLSFQYDTTFKSIIEDDSILNQAAFYFIKIFVEGSFYPLFSFLFGYSLIQLIESVKRQQRSLYPVLVRRALGLLLLGLIHHIFIWSGDILINYALTLFILLSFIKSNSKTKIICAVVFVILAVLLTATNYTLGEGNTASRATAELLQSGTYIEVLNNRLLFSLSDMDMPYIINVIVFAISMLIMTIVILPFALVGMAAAQKGYFTAHHTAPIRKYDWILLIVLGLALKIGLLFENYFGALLVTAGGYVLTFGYIKLFMLLYETVFQAKLQKFFASLGKLSLSNYLLQSIICTSIFYGYALGQFDKLGVAAGLLIAVSLYTIQGIVSYRYVNYFKQGPVESILRSWTYWGKKLKATPQPEPKHHHHHL